MSFRNDVEDRTLRGRKVWFGKHKGFFMLQAIHRNPQWFEWCIVNIETFDPYPDEIHYYKYRTLVEKVWYALGGRYDPYSDPSRNRPKWCEIDSWLENTFGGLPTEETLLSVVDDEKRANIIRNTSRLFSTFFGEDETGD